MELIKKLKNLIQKEDYKLNFKRIVEEWLQTKEMSIKESKNSNH